ncbi:MAG TPA: PLP-dependent transferase [Propionibacteriaceae bacterium]|nr:PLP-dependent transferase [Propionibacteriaceae bacterium]
MNEASVDGSDGVGPATTSVRPETLAVTTGRPERVLDAPLNQPPVFASTYIGTPEVGGGEIGYGRYGNPTWQALEDAVGALEGGRALTFASGMAAAHAVLELLPPAGTLVIPDNCYLGVSSAAAERAARYGLQVRTVNVADTAAVLAAADGADMVWLESPTNPTMEVADLPAIGAALRGRTTLVVDSTFAGPMAQRPLGTGADIVLHSATKFLSGHSDALLGALVVHEGDSGRYAALHATRSLHGATPGTMEAYLVLRGVRTLAVRLAQATANAGVLAERLATHPAVRRVRYPGLVDDPGHQVAARTMSGFGSLIAVELADAEAAEQFVAATRIWVFATSLGGVESTLERRRRWPGELPTVAEGLVRLSVGIEHVEDLWADLDQALRGVG